MRYIFFIYSRSYVFCSPVQPSTRQHLMYRIYPHKRTRYRSKFDHFENEKNSLPKHPINFHKLYPIQTQLPSAEFEMLNARFFSIKVFAQKCKKNAQFVQTKEKFPSQNVKFLVYNPNFCVISIQDQFSQINIKFHNFQGKNQLKSNFIPFYSIQIFKSNFKPSYSIQIYLKMQPLFCIFIFQYDINIGALKWIIIHSSAYGALNTKKGGGGDPFEGLQQNKRQN
eukprot:TRINITY_DN5079_c0_g1_i2.p1 TRINITY_DN5079_c0_g1~~TRINITY_DN5079_c0_g1_i2.p1  ORF type:complete len:225 (-),score=-5.84 TRINITY_DN5079_c0_g1_i2:29-703(-)